MLVTTSRLTHHVEIDGEGPPLLLINGWPQTGYAWRLVRPRLARHFRVVTAEPRGVGGSDKPEDGYDTGSLAADLAELMTTLGHERFAVLGHDVGMWVAYALAADHRDRVTALAVAEALIPGLSPSPELFGPGPTIRRLFHFAFNRLDGLNEELVRGREDAYFGHQFRSKAGVPLDPEAVRHYVDTLCEPAALAASFRPYREMDETAAQNRKRATEPLPMPVLAVGGSMSLGTAVGETMRRAAGDVTTVVLDGVGHFPAEEAPEELTAAVRSFLGR